jgi:ketosteroid isomerase-like protein
MTVTTETTKTQDEAQIRQIIADTASAICAKDLDRIMAHYAQDVIIFDAIPPFQTKGADEFRRTWEACLPCFPDSFGIEMRDLSLTVSGDLAIAHWLFHFTGMATDHPGADVDANHLCVPAETGQMADCARALLCPLRSRNV